MFTPLVFLKADKNACFIGHVCVFSDCDKWCKSDSPVFSKVADKFRSDCACVLVFFFSRDVDGVMFLNESVSVIDLFESYLVGC